MGYAAWRALSTTEQERWITLVPVAAPELPDTTTLLELAAAPSTPRAPTRKQALSGKKLQAIGRAFVQNIRKVKQPVDNSGVAVASASLSRLSAAVALDAGRFAAYRIFVLVFCAFEFCMLDTLLTGGAESRQRTTTGGGSTYNIVFSVGWCRSRAARDKSHPRVRPERRLARAAPRSTSPSKLATRPRAGGSASSRTSSCRRSWRGARP